MKALRNFCFALLMALCASSHALLPAALPNKDDVPRSAPSAIDGDWVLSVNGKRIRIEAGRAYALDPWLHMVLWTIQPDMVVIRDIETLGDGVYEGDDLPLQGRARLRWIDNANLDVTVTTGLGPVNYKLRRLAGPTTAEPGTPFDGEFEPPVDIYPAEDLPASVPEIEPPVDYLPENEPDLSPGFDPQPDEDRYTQPYPAPNNAVVPEFVTYDTFTGCQPNENSGPPGASPRERIESRVDRVTQRQFAGFTLDEARASTGGDEQLGLCWMRLDGVWQENRNIILDRSKDQPDIWGTDSPELIVLANGNYTDPRHLYIGSVGRDDEEIWVSDGTAANSFIQFKSDDGLSIEETLVEKGPTKVYRAMRRSHLGPTLRLDLTASKRARLRLNSLTFLRPSLARSEAAMQEQMASDDAFLLQANLENLIANRRGYDVVKQDPFFLLTNAKDTVFADFDAKRYYIAEQRIIPVGYKFVQSGVQGMIYSKTMTTNAREHQNSVAVALGATLEGKSDPTGFAWNASASVDVSTSWLERMEERSYAAQAVGYSRAKKYALVVDHPFVTLSDNFIDAVDDARETGRYDAIIRQFGTHYPYAVTYGAAAKITQSVTEESFKQLSEWNMGVSAEMAAGSMGKNGTVRGSISSGNVSGTSGTVGSEESTFVAVGGNGSWNENGYSLGPTPYPILLDLRPIHELLNHMNFPEQPVVYNRVRMGLKQAVERYLQSHANTVSDRSLLPALEPKEIETWHLYVRQAWCTGKGVALVHSATGTLEMEAYIGNPGKGYRTTADKSLTTKCKKKKEVETYGYKRKSPGLIEITGTREQIAAYVLKLRLKWRYTPSNRNKWRNHDKTFVGMSALKRGLAKGKSKDEIWKVGIKAKPDFFLRVRAKRIR